jgi:Fe-S-cluster containining protein
LNQSEEDPLPFVPAAEPAGFFFAFLDGSLAYDCPSCGQQCCRRFEVSLHGDEPLRLVQLRPAIAARLIRDEGRYRFNQQRGCWMLRPDGYCAVEVEAGREAKPLTCRQFPFSTLTRLGGPDGVRVVQVNTRLCPIQDVAAARAGQRWAPLAAEFGSDPVAQAQIKDVALPEGAERLGWLAHERHVRDSIAAYLEEADYTAFAAHQEAVSRALVAGAALPAPGSADSSRDHAAMRERLGRWRELLGVPADPRGPWLARVAGRQVALLTTALRMTAAFAHEPMAYPDEIARLPKLLLATALLTELDASARAAPLGLSSVSATFEDALPVLSLLSLVDRPTSLSAPLQSEGLPSEVGELLQSLSSRLLPGQRPLVDALDDAFSGAPAHLRGLALAAVADQGEALQIA